jgi:hypothetical protein
MLALYVLPMMIANTRRVEHDGTITFINIALGWTVLGWFAALIWAIVEKPREQQPGAKKSSIVLIMIVAAVFGIALLYTMLSGVARKETSVPASQSTTAQSTPATETPSVSWGYSTVKDEMTSAPIAYATAKSLNKENLHWPYGPGIGATLTLRKHPRHGKDVLVSIDKGQILCRSYESCTIVIRFDDRAPSKYSAIAPNDGSTTIVFIQNYTKFVAALKQSKKVLIELPLYQDGNRSWEFNVDGLSWQ